MPSTEALAAPPQAPPPLTEQQKAFILAGITRAKTAHKIERHAHEKRSTLIPKLTALLDTVYAKLLPVRVARCRALVAAHVIDLRSRNTAAAIHEKTAKVLRAIYVEDVESCLGLDHVPLVRNPQFPSLPLLMHLGMNFSPTHENNG
jgi:hypothetical protein